MKRLGASWDVRAGGRKRHDPHLCIGAAERRLVTFVVDVVCKGSTVYIHMRKAVQLLFHSVACSK